MSEAPEWASQVLAVAIVIAIFAPFYSFIPAFIFQFAYRWVMKESLKYARAYCAFLFGTWIVCILSFGSAFLAYLTKSILIPSAISTLIGLVLLSFFYGQYLKNSSKNAIGLKKGVLILLAEIAIIIAITIVPMIIGLIVVITNLIMK